MGWTPKQRLILALVVIVPIIPAVMALWPWFWRHMIAACVVGVCLFQALTIWRTKRFSLLGMFVVAGSLSILLALSVTPHYAFVSAKRVTLRVIVTHVATQRPIEGAIVKVVQNGNEPTAELLANGVTDDAGCVDLDCTLYVTTRRSLVRSSEKIHLQSIQVIAEADGYMPTRSKLDETIKQGGRPIKLTLVRARKKG